MGSVGYTNQSLKTISVAHSIIPSGVLKYVGQRLLLLHKYVIDEFYLDAPTSRMHIRVSFIG